MLLSKDGGGQLGFVGELSTPPALPCQLRWLSKLDADHLQNMSLGLRKTGQGISLVVLVVPQTLNPKP